MSNRRVVALTLALLASACSTNTTGVVPSLATGEDQLSADKSPATMVRVGDATRAGGDPASAIGLYRRAHELAPQDPVPLTRLGATFVELHAFTEAAEAYAQAIVLAPQDFETRRGFGALLLTLDKPELALTHLEAALAQRKDSRLYNLIGVANDLIGRHDVAQQSYAEGLRLAPDNGPLHNNLGLSQALAGDFGAAAATLSSAAASPHATARTRQNLALVYGLSGENDKAAAVARTDLDEVSVKSNLAYYAMLRGMDDRARAAAIVGGRVANRTPDAQAAASEPATPLELPPKNGTVESTPLAPPATPVAESRPALAVEAVVAPSTKRPPHSPKPRALAKRNDPAAGEPAIPPAATPQSSPPEPAEPPPAVKSEEPPVTDPAVHAATDVDETTPTAAPVIPASAAVVEEAAPTTPALADDAPAPAKDEPLKPAKGPAHRSGFLVQVGAFHDAGRAHRLCDELAAKGYDLTVRAEPRVAARDWFYCRSSAVTDHAAAAAAARRLQESESTPALVVPAALQSND
jgi:Flp pilus assembly protein TadD/cell division protein FtsN